MVTQPETEAQETYLSMATLWVSGAAKIQRQVRAPERHKSRTQPVSGTSPMLKGVIEIAETFGHFFWTPWGLEPWACIRAVDSKADGDCAESAGQSIL